MASMERFALQTTWNGWFCGLLLPAFRISISTELRLAAGAVAQITPPTLVEHTQFGIVEKVPDEKPSE